MRGTNTQPRGVKMGSLKRDLQWLSIMAAAYYKRREKRHSIEAHGAHSHLSSPVWLLSSGFWRTHSLMILTCRSLTCVNRERLKSPSKTASDSYHNRTHMGMTDKKNSVKMTQLTQYRNRMCFLNTDPLGWSHFWHSCRKTQVFTLCKMQSSLKSSSSV